MLALPAFRRKQGLVSIPGVPGSPQDVSTSSHNSTISATETRIKPPLSSTPNRKVRRVSFLPHVHVYSTIHRSHYNEEEKQRTWLSPDDMLEMKADRHQCLKKMSKINEQVDDGVHYFRGLECKTWEGNKRRRYFIADACLAVLEEQADQVDVGLQDPEAIARVYKSCSMQCVDAARQRGLFDEWAAIISVTSSLAISERVAALSPSA